MLRLGDKGSYYPKYRKIDLSTDRWKNLTPEYIKSPDGCCLENIWRFSKIYSHVPVLKTNSFCHNSQTHIDNDNIITTQYWDWRNNGCKSSQIISYPSYYQHQYYILDQKNKQPLSDKNAFNLKFKVLYDQYIQSVKELNELKVLLQNNINLLIIDPNIQFKTDDYYNSKYGKPLIDRGIKKTGTILVNNDNLDIMKEEFQTFSYCLCSLLQSI